MKSECKKIFINLKKILAKYKRIRYTINCCDMIAMKREVAAIEMAGFPRSECQVRKLATSHCTRLECLPNTIGRDDVKNANFLIDKKCAFNGVECMTHTAECTVTACRT